MHLCLSAPGMVLGGRATAKLLSSYRERNRRQAMRLLLGEAMMAPSSKCISLVKESEGCKFEAYLDPIGIWTIGYGKTSCVEEGMTCIEEQAEDWLKDDLQVAANIVNSIVKVPLNQNQFDALCDFVYNVGPGKPGKKQGFVCLKNGQPSTMLRKLNAGDYAGAAGQFRYWINAGGMKLNGLVKRRKKEEELFNTPV